MVSVKHPEESALHTGKPAKMGCTKFMYYSFKAASFLLRIELIRNRGNGAIGVVDT